MVSLLAKPSRSYKDVEHNADGLGASGTGPYASKSDAGSFKTYRPSYAEMHFKRQAMHDSHPSSSFSPLPPAFNLNRKIHKEKALAGQKAEIDHMLQPGYKTGTTSSIYGGDGNDASSVAGPSRSGSGRTAGGLGAVRKGKDTGLSVRATGSVTSFSAAPTSANSGRKSGLGGIYVDSVGRMHDTEFDPFAGVSEKSRRKSRRRSAFGHDRHRSSGESSSGVSTDNESDRGGVDRGRSSYDAVSAEGDSVDRERDEIRRRLEVERRRFDEVSGYAAARRRSMASDRGSGSFANGRATPSIRSNDDNATMYSAVTSTTHASGTNVTANGNSLAPNGRARSSNGQYIPSPLSPTFAAPPPSAKSTSSYNTTRTQQSTTDRTNAAYDDSPEKHSESTDANTLSPTGVTRISNGNGYPGVNGKSVSTKKLPEMTKQKIDKAPDGATRITGFDAPRTPVIPETSLAVQQLRIPDSARSGASGGGSSRASSDTPRQKPAERPREQLFPETPAQLKRREERERRDLRAGRTPVSVPLAVDTVTASARSRVLPEIEIVDDDDPRIVFPAHGAATRVQTTHDHVIRTPFSIAMEARRGSGATSFSDERQGSGRSVGFGDSSKATSAIIDEVGGGYLPSRWAKGDRHLRVTEEEKERYRPHEWGGKHGDLGGRTEEWRPEIKDQVKRNWKDLSTNARFSTFRLKKKLLRKTDI